MIGVPEGEAEIAGLMEVSSSGLVVPMALCVWMLGRENPRLHFGSFTRRAILGTQLGWLELEGLEFPRAVFLFPLRRHGTAEGEQVQTSC